jgi:hypothetical protein
MSIYKLDIHLTFKFLVIPRAVLYFTGEEKDSDEVKMAS